MPQQVAKNHLLNEATNHAAGEAGEELVLEYERRSLHDGGRHDLSKKVEHTAHTEGPSAGYDILSYDAGGNKKRIEVKTTRLGKRTPFFITRNELQKSLQHRDNYWLYRIFDLQKPSGPKMYIHPGAVEKWASLQAETYRGMPQLEADSSGQTEILSGV